MTYLKLELLLRETGYTPKTQQRFRVFLTNSLEEAHPDTGTLFASWLSREATEANYIKRDTPVMVVLGNPPYSVSSSNKGEWIQNLLADYKKDLNEKNINPLSDDYIKFIRYGQYFIEKNGEGVLAYISNNSFINGVIHRQMRKSLSTNFDQIYIINLHGSSKTNETTPEGGKDDNVFDIQQGVSINIFVKKRRNKNQKQAIIHHTDIWGSRESKYEQLWNNTLYSLESKRIEYKAPNYFFSEKDYQLKNQFDQGISPVELFREYSSGIQTEFDIVAIQENPKRSQEVYETIINHDVKELITLFHLSRKQRRT
jgi:predicted helicase